MKKIILFIALGMIALSFPACQDWLEVSPDSEVKGDDLFSTQDGFVDALMGVYTIMNDSTMYGGFETCLLDAWGGLVSAGSYYTSYMVDFNIQSSSLRTSLENMWLQHYFCIANVNELLVRLDNADRSMFSQGVFELLKGECLALRGFLHLDLIRMWGPVAKGNRTAEAVPYYTEVTVVPKPAETLEAAIGKVAEDLLAAREILRPYDPVMKEGYKLDRYSSSSNLSGTDFENNGFFLHRSYRMNYYAATAALARAYHHLGEKTLAATYAKEVIDSGRFPLYSSEHVTAMNYGRMEENVFHLYKRALEDKIAIRYYSQEGTADAFNNRLTLNRNAIFNKDGDISRDWRALNLFSNNLFIGYNQSAATIPILKAGEMYIIAAEAEDDFSYLNTLRQHRGYEGINYAHDTHDLDVEIEVEYIREFIGEGQSYYYYKRTGKEVLLVAPTKDHTVFFDLEYPDAELEYGNVIPKEQESKQ